ncbi:M15 family metallopeptidase [Mesorhizobium sp.]|uniref:M15 family metallopeptidase n=1 Tax=Mesorhizobium sp. TaxID=1871066 RepID=UPI00122304DD|nr:M15 family metallopeptidase [Mesorhizobium sp.]TIS45687.1 MAG: M15 family metallopeptidase [Mesorhizobium sp.]
MAEEPKSDGLRARLIGKLELLAGEHGQSSDVRRRLFPPPPDPVPETSLRTSLAGAVNRAFCQSEKFVEQQWRADRQDAHADILLFEKLLVRRMRALDVPMFAPTMWRTADDQNSAYVRGTSKAKAGESPHNFGCAVDVIHGTKGWDLSRDQWAIVAHVGKELATQNGLKLVWGGGWKFWDPAHWELADWRSHKIVRS